MRNQCQCQAIATDLAQMSLDRTKDSNHCLLHTGLHCCLLLCTVDALARALCSSPIGMLHHVAVRRTSMGCSCCGQTTPRTMAGCIDWIQCIAWYWLRWRLCRLQTLRIVHCTLYIVMLCMDYMVHCLHRVVI